jgi:hypothetical protein
MNLTDAQRQQVADWINSGAKLSEIQNRLQSELGLKLTYMEVRFLVDDLKLTPHDPEPPQAATSPLEAAKTPESPLALDEEPGLTPGGVSVTVDQLARPGAIVSGKVTFSDGQTAEWILDQAGRLGLVPKKTGYKPTTPDIQQFQMTLQTELARMGFA